MWTMAGDKFQSHHYISLNTGVKWQAKLVWDLLLLDPMDPIEEVTERLATD
jgi:hypothetical protein